MNKKNISKLLGIKFLLIGVGLTFTLVTVFAYSISGFIGMNGYAWSDNIGWISMSCKTGSPTGNDVCATNNYGVTVSTTTGNLSGYAWSDNIGWISFNSTDVSGCPVSPCAPKLTSSGLSGFAKALSGGSPESGGWDGYIDLSSVARTSETILSGYAWGSDVVGWVDMRGGATNGVTLIYEPTSATLSANPNKVSYNGTSTLTWTSTNSTSCTSGVNWSNLTPPVGNALNGNGGTGILIEDQIYTIQCFGNGDPSPVINATVDVCPSDRPRLNNSTCEYIPTVTNTLGNCNYTLNCPLTIITDGNDSCALYRNGSPTSDIISANGTTVVSLTVAGNYQTRCITTSDDGQSFNTSADATISYSPFPPKPIVSLRASPSNISVNAQTVLNWTVTFPNSVQVPVQPACTLTAKPVCPGGTCNASQLLASTTINNLIKIDGYTDSNDPKGSRKITSEAVNIIPGYDMDDNNGDTDWKATGKKTFILNHSMDFMLRCGSGVNESQGVRVLVTSSTEG